MSILNYGSINLDHVYSVPHFVRPGETIASADYQCLIGGKGANQSIALSRAGSRVFHIGAVGEADLWVKDKLAEYGVDTRYVAQSSVPTGHAMIQVDQDGENAIVLFGGANQAQDPQQLEWICGQIPDSGWLVLQNECNGTGAIMQSAKQLGLKVAFNPAPMTAAVKELPLGMTDVLVLNQTEACELAGQSDSRQAFVHLSKWFAKGGHTAESAEYPILVMTCGAEGAMMMYQGKQINMAAPSVQVVDSTGAGDTFVGYFVAGLDQGMGAELSLARAVKASALAVTRYGASEGIPFAAEIG